MKFRKIKWKRMPHLLAAWKAQGTAGEVAVVVMQFLFGQERTSVWWRRRSAPRWDSCTLGPDF